MSIQLRRINLERRRGNLEEVHRLYQHCIKEAKSVSVSSELSIKYARFLRLLPAYNTEGAINIVEEALIKDEKNARLYLQLLDIYMHSKPLNYSKVMSVFEKALSSKEVTQEKEKNKENEDEKNEKEKDDTENGKEKDEKEGSEEPEMETKIVPILSAKHRLLFSQRRLDFLEDFGDDIDEVLKAQDEHAKLKVEVKPSDSSSKAADKKKLGQTNGTATYGATGNSAAYGAAHTNQYQNYGSRYNQHYSASGYGSQYNNYYGQSGAGYGSHTSSTGGSYGNSY